MGRRVGRGVGGIRKREGDEGRGAGEYPAVY